MHSDAQQPLQAWHFDVKHSRWRSPADIKRIYVNASFLPGNRVVFNIRGNRYRIVVAVQYDFGIAYVRFVGTHKAYDKIDAATI